MAEFRMPSLGADMTAGTLVEWKVRPGERVTRGQIVADVETDKGVVEVEIFESGVVDQLLVAPGTRVPVGTPLATLTGGEAPRPEVPAAPARPAVATAPPPEPPRRPRVSPLARRRAAERGVDLSRLTGTGHGGAIVVADVEAALGTPPAPGAPPPTATGRSGAMRTAIAAAMSRSKREIPHYYLRTDIDLARLTTWLATHNAGVSLRERMLLAVPLLRACALALREVPGFNGYVVDGTFQPAEVVHLGVAIALRQGGLVAPAIHDADRKTLEELRKALDDLVARVRRGSMRSSELADPTATVTSLGDQGVAEVYGVIFPPQVAIIGLGRVMERTIVVEGNIAVRPVLTATLAADHRVTDGMQGARLLRTLDRLLQDPEEL